MFKVCAAYTGYCYRVVSLHKTEDEALAACAVFDGPEDCVWSTYDPYPNS
jgi:hypothetical protein